MPNGAPADHDRRDDRRNGQNGGPKWLRWVWQYGFTLFFGVVVLLAGLRAGQQFAETQRLVLVELQKTQDLMTAQVAELKEVNQRLERIEKVLLAGAIRP